MIRIYVKKYYLETHQDEIVEKTHKKNFFSSCTKAFKKIFDAIDDHNFEFLIDFSVICAFPYYYYKRCSFSFFYEIKHRRD